MIAACAAVVVGGGFTTSASAQNYPITPAQRSTAQQVASAGVPLSELAPDAPDSYTVKPGDTLWAISGLFLRSPWRWPELWGMNMDQVRNPHRIYPGQTLYLEKANGLARLRIGQPPAGADVPLETVRVSPRTRLSSVADLSIPTLPPHLIEPFLNEAIIVDEGVLERAPRIVAAPEDRVLLTRGDRAYARGRVGTPLVETDPRVVDTYRVFRNAKALKDPMSGRVLGYEAQYLGNAELVRSEAVQPVRTSGGKVEATIVPATIDITRAKEEMRVGDRLLPEPPRVFTSYVPRAPQGPVDGAIVSVYGDAVSLIGQNQVVSLNLGRAEGLEPGHVLSILKYGRQLQDRTITAERAVIKVPDERNGMLMVFRTFEHMSYALVLQVSEPLAVGDRVATRAEHRRMERDELAGWLRLALTPGVSDAAARKLLAAFGLPQAIFQQSSTALAQVVPASVAQALGRQPERLDERVAATLAWIAQAPTQRQVTTLGDPHYPAALLRIEDPPLMLYRLGRLLEPPGRAVAVVGSRNPTPQGLQNARRFARALAEAGVTVVSGMALGIDGAAHEGALEGAADDALATIAVVGTGLDITYPKAHQELAERIARHGSIVSEYPLGTPPLQQNFPRRNRLIAAFSQGTLVVEAALQSGSLITARLAAEQGKEVFAIPGSIHSPHARGCHALLRQGAKLVESAQDVLEDLKLVLPAAPAPAAEEREGEDPLLEAMGFDPIGLDALIARTGIPAPLLQAQLLELELAGQVARLPGGLFQRTGSA